MPGDPSLCPEQGVFLVQRWPPQECRGLRFVAQGPFSFIVGVLLSLLTRGGCVRAAAAKEMKKKVSPLTAGLWHAGVKIIWAALYSDRLLMKSQRDMEWVRARFLIMRARACKHTPEWLSNILVPVVNFEWFLMKWPAGAVHLGCNQGRCSHSIVKLFTSCYGQL